MKLILAVFLVLSFGSVAQSAPFLHDNACTYKGGIVSNYGATCWVPKTVLIHDGQNKGKVMIDPTFAAGKLLIATGTQGAVVITLNNRFFANANSRVLATQGGGDLAFEILDPQRAEGSAVVYQCFDRNLHIVFCDPKHVPAHP